MFELYDTPFYKSLSEAEKYFVNGMRDLLRRLDLKPTTRLASAILENGVVVECDDTLALLWWGKNQDACHIGKEVICGYEVSTIFMPTPCGYSGKERKPLHFETMVFGPKGETTGQRYETLDEARKGHASMVQCLKERSEKLLQPLKDEE